MVACMTVYKLVILGDAGVGKTALAIQLCLNHFGGAYDPTIEESYQKQAVIDSQSCTLEILDTAGQEEYAALRDQWIRYGEGFVLVYSISSRSSFTRIQEFHDQIQRVKKLSASSSPFPDSPLSAAAPERLVPVMLVGNKSDKAEREVSVQEGRELAKKLGCEFVEASARNCINVEKAFYNVVQLIQSIRHLPGRTGIVAGRNGKRESQRDSQTKALSKKCVIL